MTYEMQHFSAASDKVSDLKHGFCRGAARCVLLKNLPDGTLRCAPVNIHDIHLSLAACLITSVSGCEFLAAVQRAQQALNKNSDPGVDHHGCCARILPGDITAITPVPLSRLDMGRDLHFRLSSPLNLFPGAWIEGSFKTSRKLFLPPLYAVERGQGVRFLRCLPLSPLHLRAFASLRCAFLRYTLLHDAVLPT